MTWWIIIKINKLQSIKMFESLDPFQQVLIGVSSVGIIMIVLVIFLTASPNFQNTDRLKKILDFLEKNK